MYASARNCSFQCLVQQGSREQSNVLSTGPTNKFYFNLIILTKLFKYLNLMYNQHNYKNNKCDS